MANEIGSALLTSITGSSFDIGNMSKTLAEAEIAGPRAILERHQEQTNTELDGLKYLKTNLDAFNSYVTDLTSPALFNQRQSTSSDESVVSISSTSSAVLASYQVESKQLAQAHTLVSNTAFSSPSDAVTTGTLNIQIGGQAHLIPVDTSNNTMEGVQKTINNGDYGVTASIINNGGSYQMMFSSKETGAASQVSISGIPEFSSSTTTAQAQDAVMVLNGLTVTSTTNSFDNVIEGVTFNLNSASPGLQKTVSIGQDSQGIKDTISSFVEVYNQLGSIVDELGKYDTNDLTQAELDSPEFQYYGDLAGNSVLRSVENQLQQSLRGVLDGFSTSSIRTLADVGISTDKDGVLQMDAARLDTVMSTNMQAVSDLFARGGTSDDPLVNVLGGNDKTQVGDYSLSVTQVAERATVVAGAASTLTTDERLASDSIVDMSAALTIDAGATFDLSIGGTPTTLDLTLIDGKTYANKDAVATAIQSVLDAQVPGLATIAYDSTQARFEFTAAPNKGSLDMTAISGLSNQGFSAASYAGEQLIDLSGADATFNVQIDGSTSSAVTISAGQYTMSEMTKVMTSSINSNSDVQAAGAEVTVAFDAANKLSVTSNRFGIASTVDLTNFASFGNAGFANTALAVGVSDVGQNVDGTLTTATGALNIGAYADSEDGRKIKISDYAVINGDPAEVRGLEFEVLGGLSAPTGQARGVISFSQGFASKLEETINNLFKSDTGLVSQRIENLNNSVDDQSEKSKKVDARYEQLLLKYQMQFSALQSIMASSEQTRNYLTSTFSNNNN